MAANQRYDFSDQEWFDANNPGTLHDALRKDFMRTRAAVDRRPSLQRHVAECGVCQSIAAAAIAVPPPTSGRKRIKLVINLEQMHRLLNLPESFEIIHMYADPDPNAVTVLVAGENLPEVDPLSETPVTPLDAARHAAWPDR